MSKVFNISQANIALGSLVLGTITVTAFYLIGSEWLASGTVFGIALMLLNWKALDKVLLIAFRFTSPMVMKLISFFLYHIRFLLVVFIMFLVIPKTNLYFGIGSFIGFIIPKVVLGIIILKNRSDEWWLKRVQDDQEHPSEKIQTLLEKELFERNPFEVDPIGIEVRRYYQSLKGDCK